MFAKGFCGWGEPILIERLAEIVKKKAHKDSLCVALDFGGYLDPAWLLAGFLFLP